MNGRLKLMQKHIKENKPMPITKFWGPLENALWETQSEGNKKLFYYLDDLAKDYKPTPGRCYLTAYHVAIMARKQGRDLRIVEGWCRNMNSVYAPSNYIPKREWHFWLEDEEGNWADIHWPLQYKENFPALGAWGNLRHVGFDFRKKRYWTIDQFKKSASGMILELENERSESILLEV